jgi:hypothetical protein
LCRSIVKAIPTPIKIKATVAPKLAGAMQLRQVPMIAGASYIPRSCVLLGSVRDVPDNRDCRKNKACAKRSR